MLSTLSETPLRAAQVRVERAMERYFETLEPDAPLTQAMRYAALGGGKRLRATLVYATGECFGAPQALLDDAAVAIEFMHAYSLVHDDLPCMDDDDIRRGQPTCHRAFGEPLALLAGDALQTSAFEVLAEGSEPARCAMVARLARAAGPHGMAGGQALDLLGALPPFDESHLEQVARRKTGALLAAAIMLGALAGRAPGREHDALERFGADLGLLFQITDDLLDFEQDQKAAGANRPSYALLLGPQEARARVTRLRQEALVNLAVLGDNAGFLGEIADLIAHRHH